jgi:hypothetical protein
MVTEKYGAKDLLLSDYSLAISESIVRSD